MSTSTWRMNSVRWLEENKPSVVAGFISNTPAPERLLRALSLLDYLGAEEEVRRIASGMKAPSPKELVAKRKAAIDNWSEGSHRDMVQFIEEGGYKARRALLLGAKDTEDAYGEDLTMTDEDGRPVGEKMVVVQNGRRAGKATAAKKHAGVDDLDDAIIYGSPTAGSW